MLMITEQEKDSFAVCFGNFLATFRPKQLDQKHCRNAGLHKVWIVMEADSHRLHESTDFSL